MHGFLNVDKPRGITSFEVVRRIRTYFRGRRVGHLGTLDPMADGVLPVAVGEATRLVEFLMDTRKGYRAQMTFGGVSDTQDAWGNITYTADFNIHQLQQDLAEVLKSFLGEIEQVPPMYSAINYQGQRLYKLARRGETVELQPRRVTIYSLRLVDSYLDNPPYRAVVEVVCSKGTYIRTLCHDIGQKLGCGAYLSGLTRLFSGPFRLEEATQLDELEHLLKRGDSSVVLPFEFPLAAVPEVELQTFDEVRRIKNGNTIDIAASSVSGLVRIYSPAKELLALGYLSATPRGGGRLKPAKVFNL